MPQNDVYAMCLSLLLIESYKRGSLSNSEFFPHHIYYTLKQYDKIYDNIIKYLEKQFHVGDQQGPLEDCTELYCVLFKGMRRDITEIPTAQDIANQLRKIVSSDLNNVYPYE